LGLLIAGSFVWWLVLAYPANRLGGSEALIYTVVACLLCLAPTAGTLLLAEWAEQRAPGNWMLMLLAGSGIRMAVVIGAGLVICLAGLPGLAAVNVVAFWIWVLVFYLFSLALEIVLVLSGRKAQQGVGE
jgi:hypothetical protein